jgi:hypothetical protein
MKKLVLAIFASSLIFSCKKNSSQSATPTLDSPAYAFFPGFLNANNMATVFTNDGNIAILGKTLSENVLLLKLSMTGNQILRKEITLVDSSGSGAPGVVSMAVTADNGYLLCGSAYRGNTSDIYLLKLNSAGNVEWSKTYGGDKGDYGQLIIKTHDGNYLLCGITYSFTTEGYDDIYLVKVNANGETIWSHSYLRHEQQTPYNLIETKNGDYIVTGTDEPTGDGRIAYLLSVNANGDKLWENTVGTVPVSHWKWALGSAECSNGDLMLCGQTDSKVLLIRTDKTGNELWEKTYFPDSSYGSGISMKITSDNSCFVTGGCNAAGTNRCFLLKADKDGNQVFFKKFPGTPSMHGVNMLLGANNDVLLTGSQSINNNTTNIFFTRTDGNGNYK